MAVTWDKSHQVANVNTRSRPITQSSLASYGIRIACMVSLSTTEGSAPVSIITFIGCSFQLTRYNEHIILHALLSRFCLKHPLRHFFVQVIRSRSRAPFPYTCIVAIHSMSYEMLARFADETTSSWLILATVMSF